MLKKIVASMLVLIFTISSAHSLIIFASESINFNIGSANQIVITDVRGIERGFSLDVNPITSEYDFNYTASEIALSLNGSRAKLEILMDDVNLEFDFMLNPSQIGYNNDNRIFGVAVNTPIGFQMTRFVIERNSSEFFLLEPNLYLKGRTVATIVLLDESNGINYFFQFPVDSLIFPYLTTFHHVGFEVTDAEISNFVALPTSMVLENFRSVNTDLASGMEMKTITSNDFEYRFDAQNHLPSIGDTDTEIYSDFDILSPSVGSMLFDSLIEQSNHGPINIGMHRNLIENVPDWLFGSRNTQGWSHDWLGWRFEGPNSMRNTGFSIFHMPDSWTGNVMNYVMRYEGIGNFNFPAQRFISTFLITHNVWVQFLVHNNTSFIFDDRASNARLRVNVDNLVGVPPTPTVDAGFFTHYSVSSISHGSRLPNFLRAAIEWVPVLSTVVTSIELITSGTRLQTDGIHPTHRFARQITATVNNLRNPGDHITLTGYGSGVNSIQYGQSSLWLNVN